MLFIFKKDILAKTNKENIPNGKYSYNLAHILYRRYCYKRKEWDEIYLFKRYFKVFFTLILHSDAYRSIKHGEKFAHFLFCFAEE